MKQIKIGDKTVNIKAAPPGLIFYKREFGKEILDDFPSMIEKEGEKTVLNSEIFLQVVWVMAKTAAGPGAPFPSYEDWLWGLGNINLRDSQMFVAVQEEAFQGFFRSGGSEQSAD